MSDSNSLAARMRGLSWLFIETPARAAGFLSAIAIVTILALRFEFGHSWNLYASGGQVAKAGEDYPLLLQAVGSAYQETGGELVIFVGGSTVRELTADDWLLSKELTSRCGRDVQFVNLGSSSQTFSESWDIAALAPANRKRLLLVGINPYRLSFDDGDVISEQSHNPTGIPASFSLWWSVARHTGHVGSLERMFASVARQIKFGAKWSPLDFLISRPAVARQPAEDPFQPDRSSYPGPAWTRPEKLKQANEYIATRALDFHDRFRAGVKWFNRLSDQFQGPDGDVSFVITPTDETFRKVDRLITNDMRDVVNLLQAKNGILDLRNQGVDLAADDFHDVQHLTANGRAKLQPVSWPRCRAPWDACWARHADMSRLIAIFLVALATVGVLEAVSFGKQAELHVYHLSVSPGGNELLREPLHEGQPVTLRADAGDSLAIELDPKAKQIGGVLTIAGSNGRATLRMFDDKTLGPGERDCTTAASGAWQCRVFWRITKPRTERLPLFPAADAVTIASVTFNTTSVPRAPATTFAGLLLFLAVLVVLAPLIVTARRVSLRLELSILIGLSAAWIATTGVESALAIAAFLALGYFLVRLELRRRETRTSILLLTIGFVALVLFYFKVLAPYASAAFGQASSLALPLGLSYFGIRLIDVIFAARAGTLKEVRMIEFLGFMLHPSMLAAGPITTLGEFRRARIADWSVTDYGSGIARCLVGLVKKSSADLLLAPGVLKLAQTVALHPDAVTARTVWPMLLGQLLYIYLDFSGYTDLALGTGRALGWRLPENFNWPLAKSNLQRYWQSWHMTLSNWVMRRVYFPAFMQSRSPILAAVCAMSAIGVWHQPDFAWTAWALHHGIGLGVTIKCRDVGFRERGILTRCAGTPRGRVTMGLLGWAFTVSWVALGLSYTLFDNYLISFAAIRGAFRF